MNRNVNYFPQFEGFGMADSTLKRLAKKGVPMLSLKNEDYESLGCSIPSANAPVIGLLLGREDGHFMSGRNYVLALAKKCARIIFLDYEHHREQLVECDAVVLPGGSFSSPEVYYSDAKTKRFSCPSVRSQAYVDCIRDALHYKMPILGICAGAQLVAAAFGLKLYRGKDGYFETPIEHKTLADKAHRVFLKPDTPFSRLMDNQQSMFVNSRHSEFLAPENVQRELLGIAEGKSLPLDIYATASDGIPEAWGKMEDGILCIQWHPEDLAAHGDQIQQLPYDWIAEMARFAKSH